MSTRPLVEASHLVRWFGHVHALDRVSFSIARGTVVGLIGANGAGKTTAMRILATLDLPDAGQVLFDGIDVADEPDRVRPRIGWMPDHFGRYAQMSVVDYLDFFARAYGLRGAARGARVAEVVAFTELDPLLDRPLEGLSKGQSQRVGVARLLLPDPEFLILDEPAAGLDPKARLEFKNLVRLLSGAGKTLLISSHILSELAEMCDTLLFLDGGRLVHEGDAQSLLDAPGAQSVGVVVEILVAGDPAPLLAWLGTRPGWSDPSPVRRGARARFAQGDPEALAGEVGRLVADGVRVADFHVQERRLEEAFVDMLRVRDRASVRPPPLPVVPPPLP